MMKVDPFVTKDGSSTLFSKRYNQYYHNPNGLSESQTVFIKRLNIKHIFINMMVNLEFLKWALARDLISYWPLKLF